MVVADACVVVVVGDGDPEVFSVIVITLTASVTIGSAEVGRGGGNGLSGVDTSPSSSASLACFFAVSVADILSRQDERGVLAVCYCYCCRNVTSLQFLKSDSIVN